MRLLVAQWRVPSGLRTRVPAAADSDIRPGMRFLVYREKPVNQWTSPFPLEGKLAILLFNGQLKQFSVDKLKEYRGGDEQAMQQTDSHSCAAPGVSQEQDLGRMLDAVISDDQHSQEARPATHQSMHHRLVYRSRQQYRT